MSSNNNFEAALRLVSLAASASAQTELGASVDSVRLRQRRSPLATFCVVPLRALDKAAWAPPPGKRDAPAPDAAANLRRVAAASRRDAGAVRVEISVWKAVVDQQRLRSDVVAPSMLSVAAAAAAAQPWAVLLCRGGNFAGVIFNPDGSAICHKTFARYTTRRKQGGGQSAHDSKSGAASSAGASIRRQMEVELSKEIRALLNGPWRVNMARCASIFLGVSKTAAPIFYGGGGKMKAHNQGTGLPPLKSKDPRCRTVPFPTSSPTFSEAKRTYAKLSSVHCRLVRLDDECAEVLGETCATLDVTVAALPLWVDDVAEESESGGGGGAFGGAAATWGELKAAGTAADAAEDVAAEEARAKEKEKEKEKVGAVAPPTPPTPADAAFAALAAAVESGEVVVVSELLRVAGGGEIASVAASVATATSLTTAAPDSASASASASAAAVTTAVAAASAMRLLPLDDARLPHAQTLLHSAASGGVVAVITALLRHGADPTIRDARGREPYTCCTTKAARRAFRDHRASAPSQWPYDAMNSIIPTPVVRSAEEAAALDAQVVKKRKEKRQRKRENKKEAKKAVEAEQERAEVRAEEALARGDFSALEGAAKREAQKNAVARAADDRLAQKLLRSTLRKAALGIGMTESDLATALLAAARDRGVVAARAQAALRSALGGILVAIDAGVSPDEVRASLNLAAAHAAARVADAPPVGEGGVRSAPPPPPPAAAAMTPATTTLETSSATKGSTKTKMKKKRKKKKKKKQQQLQQPVQSGSESGSVARVPLGETEKEERRRLRLEAIERRMK